jgi:hypothetical protein
MPSPTFLLFALTGLSHAFIADLFADQHGQIPAGTRNVYDNTCAPLGGSQSFRFTTSGGGNQCLRSYSYNNCFPQGKIRCELGVASGTCFTTVYQAEGSNAMSSCTIGCN